MKTRGVCAHCNADFDTEVGAINRAKRGGRKLYCSRKCSGLGRRKNKTKAQRVLEKKLYDEQYRAKNAAMLKAKKRAYFERTYDPATAAIDRKKRMPRHVEYCRRPEYRAKKHQYDVRRYHGRTYGEFAEVSLALQALEAEVTSRMSKYDIMLANGTINKKQQRRREYERLNGGKSQAGAVGNLERHQVGQDASESG